MIVVAGLEFIWTNSGMFAGDSIDGRDRQRIERMCRYLARPPIAMERLTELGDGDLRYELKKAWRDGTRFVTLDPYELITRIWAMGRGSCAMYLQLTSAYALPVQGQ